MCPNTLSSYYKGYAYYKSGDIEKAKECCQKGESLSSDYVFPNKIEEMIILENAVSVLDEAPMASYYLGNFYYDKKEYEKAILNWERSADEKPDFALSYRNLSIAYFNKRKDIPKAKSLIEKAFSLEKDNSRLLLEQDQLYKKAGVSCEEGLSVLENNRELLDGRDVLFLSYIALLNKNGNYEKALNLIENHIFHPWEGGEGKVSGEISYAFGSELEKLLDKNIDKPNWQISYQKSLMLYDRRDFEKAKTYCEKSFLYDNNFYQNHLYAHILYQLENESFTYFAKKAIKQNSKNYSLCESLIVLLLNGEKYRCTIDCFDNIDEKIKAMPRLQMYLSRAYLGIGNAKKAEKILTSNGGLKLLDFREGDKFLDKLYREIRVSLYGENYKDIVVPKQFDFIVSDFKTD